MPSSTSSSEHPALARHWARTWALTAVLVLGPIGLLEPRLRAAGIRPSVEDSQALWASTRDEADDTTDAVVFLGSSRTLRGIDLPTFAAHDPRPGRRLIQLALESSAPLTVLEDLSHGSLTRSIVLCELIPAQTSLTARAAEEIPRQRLAYRRSREAWRAAEVALESALRMRLVSLRPNLSPYGLLRLPRPSTWQDLRRFTVFPTRQTIVNYTDPLAQDRRWASELLARAPHRSDHDRVARLLNDSVRRLREQGTRIVFLRLPSSGLTKEIEDLCWPRTELWERLAVDVDAPFVHFEDEPELRSSRCVDGSHLGEAAAREFTRGLVQVLQRRGLLAVDVN